MVDVSAFDAVWSEPRWVGTWLTCFLGWACIWLGVADDLRIRDCHAIIITSVALLCIGGWVPEIVVIHLSSSYFLVTTLHACRWGQWKMLVGHHLPSLALFASQPLFPAMLTEHWASRLLLIESSTPFLTRWRRSRQKDHFQQFMAWFFCIRVLYLSWQSFLYVTTIGGYPGIALGMLVLVNIYWFWVQLEMLWDYQPDAVGPGDYGCDQTSNACCEQDGHAVEEPMLQASKVTIRRRTASGSGLQC